MTSTTLRTAFECPECAGEVPLADGVMLHEILPCAHCGADLEVLGLDPVSVGLAPEIEEDWGE